MLAEVENQNIILQSMSAETAEETPVGQKPADDICCTACYEKLDISLRQSIQDVQTLAVLLLQCEQLGHKHSVLSMCTQRKSQAINNHTTDKQRLHHCCSWRQQKSKQPHQTNQKAADFGRVQTTGAKHHKTGSCADQHCT